MVVELTNGVYSVPLSPGSSIPIGEFTYGGITGACNTGASLYSLPVAAGISIGPDFLSPRYTHRLTGVNFFLNSPSLCGVIGDLQFVYDNLGGGVLTGQLVSTLIPPSAICPSGLVVDVSGTLTMPSAFAPVYR